MSRVLVVDDSVEKRRILAFSLKSAGFEVDEAETADQAYAAVDHRSGEYDFLLVDQVLGYGEDGLHLTQKLLSQYENLRIVMFTRYGTREACREALDAGAYRYLFHDFRVEDVVAVIKAAHSLREIEEGLSGARPQPGGLWLRPMLDGLGVGVSIIDRTYRILYMNPALASMSREKARVGGVCWVEFNGDVRQRDACPWCPVKVTLVTKGTHTSRTFSEVNGVMREFNVMAAPILDPTGSEVIGAVEIIIDVTEQAEAERSLLRAETLDLRLEAAVQKIQALGYRRARLYRLTADGRFLQGVKAFGATSIPIETVFIPVEKDPYSKKTLESQGPQVYKDEEMGPKVFAKELATEGIEEWLDIPLRVDEQPQGKITADNDLPERRDPRDKRPLPALDAHSEDVKRIADYAAAAIADDARTTELLDNAEFLGVLRDMDRELANQQELTKDLEIIVRYAHRLTDALCVTIRMPDDGRLRLVAGQGLYADHARDVVALDDRGYGSVDAYIRRKAYICHNTKDHAHFQAFKGAHRRLHAELYAELELVKSFGSFPLTTGAPGDPPVGVISFQSTKADFFSPHKVGLIHDFCLRAAYVIQTAQLIRSYDESEKGRREQLSTIAHSLTTPLNNLRQYARELVDNWGPTVEDGDFQPAQTIARETEHLIRQTHDLLNLIHYQENDLRATIEEGVDLGNMTKDVVNLFRPTVEHFGRQPIELDAADRLLVRADPDHIWEVIQNLMCNAVQYAASRVRLSLRQEGDYALIAMWNDGNPIPPHEKPKVFEAQFRGEAAKRRAPQGRGIGLHVTKALVELHGGRIWFESNLDEGTTFFVELPVRGPEGGC